MEPQQTTENFDVSKLPDLRKEWSSTAAKDVWGPDSESSKNSGFSKFLVHKGGKLAAGEGTFVATDSYEKPEPPQQYSTRIRTSYLKIGPVLHPIESEVKEPIESAPRPYLYNAEVEAQKGSKVLAENASVSARMGSYVQSRWSTVEALEGSVVRAQEGSNVSANQGARVLAEDRSSVTARSGSRVVALDGSRITAEPGSEIDARAGSTIRLSRRDNGDNGSNQVKLKAEKGAAILIGDPSAVIDPSTQADLRFTGDKHEWAVFKANNPDLKIAKPNFSTLADLVYGTAETPPSESTKQAGAGTRDANPLSKKKEPPSPAPEGNYDRLEENLKRLKKFRDTTGY